MKEYRDFYFRKAKSENYPARSVYKLKEMDAKFHLLGRGMKALDLGASPGSWSLACAEKVGPSGLVLACDLKPPETALPPQVIFMLADVFAPSPEFSEELARHGPFDIVLSDMAPATTGSKFTDQARSFALAAEAFRTACGHLKRGGNFAAKIFMGPDFRDLLDQIATTFDKAKTFKPKSSRSESRETFLIGLGFNQKFAPEPAKSPE